MSDIERHNEANAVEMERHNLARDTENARHTEASNTVEESDAHVRELDARISLAQARAKHSMYVAFSIAGAIVLFTIVLAVYVVRDRSSSDRSSRTQIENLTAQVVGLTSQLDAARATRNEIDLCQSRFDGRVSAAARESNISEHELVVLIATVVPEERATKIGDKVAQLDSSTVAYRAAGDARDAWVNAGKPLPCPI